MSESKSTPHNTKLANVSLGLEDKEDQSGLCNLQTSSSQLWSESYGMMSNPCSISLQTSVNAIQNVINSFDPDYCNCIKSKCLKL